MGFLGETNTKINFMTIDKDFVIKNLVTKELQDTLRIHPEHKVVYFDAKCNHYFNVFSLKNYIKKTVGKNTSFVEDGEKPKLYGGGIFSHRQVIPGIHNIDKRTEAIAKGDPNKLIVLSVSREDILNAQPKLDGDSILAQVSRMKSGEQRALLQMLMPQDVLDMWKKYDVEKDPSKNIDNSDENIKNSESNKEKAAKNLAEAIK